MTLRNSVALQTIFGRATSKVDGIVYFTLFIKVKSDPKLTLILGLKSMFFVRSVPCRHLLLTKSVLQLPQP